MPGNDVAARSAANRHGGHGEGGGGKSESGVLFFTCTTWPTARKVGGLFPTTIEQTSRPVGTCGDSLPHAKVKFVSSGAFAWRWQQSTRSACRTNKRRNIKVIRGDSSHLKEGSLYEDILRVILFVPAFLKVCVPPISHPSCSRVPAARSPFLRTLQMQRGEKEGCSVSFFFFVLSSSSLASLF